jgi:hypothetical protein
MSHVTLLITRVVTVFRPAQAHHMDELAKVRVLSSIALPLYSRALSNKPNLEDLPTARLEGMLRVVRSERRYLQDRMEVLKALAWKRIGELRQSGFVAVLSHCSSAGRAPYPGMRKPDR